MDNDTDTDIIEVRPNAKDEDSNSSGWDPYIFSIFAGRKKSYPEERRRKPRTRDALRRRALLIAKGRRQKD